MTFLLSALCFLPLFSDRISEINTTLFDKKLSYREKAQQIYKFTDQYSLSETETPRLSKYCDSLLSLKNNQVTEQLTLIKVVKSFAMKRAQLYLESVEFLKSVPRDSDPYVNALVEHHIARAYLGISDYNSALGYFLSSLKFYNSSKEFSNEKIATLSHVANCYRRTNNYEKNLEFINLAISTAKELDNTKLLYRCYSQLALHYLVTKEISKADSVYSAILNYEGYNVISKVAILSNLSEVHLLSDKVESAEKLIKESYALAVAERDTFWMSITLIGHGSVYNKKGDYRQALKACSEAYRFALSRRSVINQKTACECLYESNLKLKNYQAALENHIDLIKLRDSIFNENNNREITRKEMQFEYDKKEAEVRAIAKVEKEKTELKAEEDKKRLNLIIISVIAGLVLVSVFSFFIYRSLQKNKHANKIITAQKHLVEEKQKEILDSIQYAKRIQQSLMPTEKYIERNMAKSKDNKKAT